METVLSEKSMKNHYNVKIFSFQPNPTCLKLAVVLPKEVKGIAYLFLRQKG